MPSLSDWRQFEDDHDYVLGRPGYVFAVELPILFSPQLEGAGRRRVPRAVGFQPWDNPSWVSFRNLGEAGESPAFEEDIRGSLFVEVAPPFLLLRLHNDHKQFIARLRIHRYKGEPAARPTTCVGYRDQVAVQEETERRPEYQSNGRIHDVVREGKRRDHSGRGRGFRPLIRLHARALTLAAAEVVPEAWLC
jgi:hypothetical protein